MHLGSTQAVFLTKRSQYFKAVCTDDLTSRVYFTTALFPKLYGLAILNPWCAPIQSNLTAGSTAAFHCPLCLKVPPLTASSFTAGRGCVSLSHLQSHPTVMSQAPGVYTCASLHRGKSLNHWRSAMISRGDEVTTY